MKTKLWKTVQALLCLLLLAAVVGTVTLFRAAAEVERVWQTAQQSLQQVHSPKDPVFAAPVPTVLDTDLMPTGAEKVIFTDPMLPEGALYDFVQSRLPQYAHCAATASIEPRHEPLQTAVPEWTLQLPDDYDAHLTVTDPEGIKVFDGAVQQSYTRTFAANGTDVCTLTLQRKTAEGRVSFTYEFQVMLDVQPTVTLSTETAAQGDVVAVLVSGNIFGEPMSLSTELGLCDFVPLDAPGSYGAYVPVAYNRGVGAWPIEVTVGDTAHTLSVQVEKRDFTVQHMTISQSVADSTWNSAAASTEYRAAIYPLYELTDNERHWDGAFIEPVTGYRLTTQYGLWRYTNGKYSERHSGIDMACALGTPISAPQNGVVLFADYLQLTGYTIVIAHGGGVKSMFYHMNSIDVAAGDTVTTGQKIAEVGTTGYSTGPHLHYEVKIGSQSIDPFQLFDGTSGLFAGLSAAD